VPIVLAAVAYAFWTTALPAAPASPPADVDAVSADTDTADATAVGLDAGPIDDLDLLDLKIDTVVTGLRRARSLDDTPYAISVITAQDIRDAGVRTVPEALRLIPGVDVGAMYANITYIGMRGYFGSQAEQNVILIDGRRLQAPVLGRGDFSIVEVEDTIASRSFAARPAAVGVQAPPTA
jgi:outer membrane cobalamin receptor